MMKLVAKVYFNLTSSSHLPTAVRDQASFDTWQNLLLQLLALPIPEEAQPTDHEDRLAFPWWKAKKWAAHTQQRFLLPGTFDPKKHPFKEAHAVATTQTFLGVLQAKHQGAFVTSRLLNVALTTVTLSINHGSTFKVLKPHIAQLIGDIVFPYMCIQPEDEELWASDPEEYVRRTMDIAEDIHSPASAAVSCIMQLVAKRSKTCLQPALEFASRALAESQGPANYRQKFGALSLVVALKDKLTQGPEYTEQVGFMLANYVLPEFESQQGMLRAKACILCCEYAEFATTLASQGKQARGRPPGLLTRTRISLDSALPL